jgi:glycerol kinase
LMQTPLRRPVHLEATVAGAALAAWTHLAPHVSHEATAHYREIKPQRQAQWAEQRYKKWLRAAAAVHAYYDITMDS